MSVVVVPCHDETDRLDVAALTDLIGLCESVVFVDDGSTDDTAAIIESVIRGATAADGSGSAELLHLAHNVGKAEAVRAGMRRALELGADTVGYLDADMATPPSEVARLEAALGDHIDVVLGSRVRMLGHAIDRRAARHYLGRIYATFASVALRLDVYDTQCGAKLFRATGALRAALDEPFEDPWAFDVELLSRLLSPNDPTIDPVDASRMVEVPLERWRDVDGSGLSVRAGLRATMSLASIARRTRSGRLNGG